MGVVPFSTTLVKQFYAPSKTFESKVIESI